MVQLLVLIGLVLSSPTLLFPNSVQLAGAYNPPISAVVNSYAGSAEVPSILQILSATFIENSVDRAIWLIENALWIMVM